VDAKYYYRLGIYHGERTRYVNDTRKSWQPAIDPVSRLDELCNDLASYNLSFDHDAFRRGFEYGARITSAPFWAEALQVA
jgi:hypothetical protein